MHFNNLFVLFYITKLFKDVMEQPNLRNAMATNFNEVAPICFLYERDTEHSAFISQELRSSFLNAPLFNNRSLGLEHVRNNYKIVKQNIACIYCSYKALC